MLVTIETYRGIDIEFETSSEKFQCLIDEVSNKQSDAYSTIKKYIDEYLRNNHDFKPFKVFKYSSRFSDNNNIEIYGIVGIRKDGDYIILRNGKKERLSNYDLTDYFVFNEKDTPILDEIAKVENEYTAYHKKYTEKLKELKSEVISINLKTYKQTNI
jgi:hypothetical protein